MNLANCAGSCGTVAQTYNRFMPRASGSQNRNISHQLPAAASHMRRPRRPQLPPLVYCNISRAREPVVSPSQNMNECSHARRNKSHWLRPSVRPRARTVKTTPTTSERERMRSITAGGAKSLGVTRTRIWLIALHLPQAVLRGAGPRYLGSVFHLLLVYSTCRDRPAPRPRQRRAGLTAAREYMRRWPS